MIFSQPALRHKKRVLMLRELGSAARRSSTCVGAKRVIMLQQLASKAERLRGAMAIGQRDRSVCAYGPLGSYVAGGRKDGGRHV
jgi:hypothetical protein